MQGNEGMVKGGNREWSSASNKLHGVIWKEVSGE